VGVIILSLEVTMYSSDYCGYCVRARHLLESKGADVIELNVDGDGNLRKQMKQKSGCHTVPQIWIGEQHIGGCDDLYRLERAGKLDLLLNINK
jgi:glutaredoxin 3